MIPYFRYFRPITLLFFIFINVIIPYGYAQDDDLLTLTIQFTNQASQSITFEDGNDFDGDNIYITPSILQNSLSSRKTENIATLTWPQEGESSFHYLLNFRSADKRYFCSLKIRSLYYDTEVGKKLFVKTAIENAPSIEKKYADCDKIKFQSHFIPRSNGNGLISVIAKGF